MAKNLLIRTIKDVFDRARQSIWWKRFQSLPFPVRLMCGIVSICLGILGILTPIPFGMVFLIIGIAVFIGLRRTRSYTLGFIHWTRLHILYGRLYVWWKNRKK